MKKKKVRQTNIPDEQTDSVFYSSVEYPIPDGKSIRHRPRKNYWGNLIENDTYQENSYNSSNYDYSDSDYEDDHDNFYSNNHYI